MSNATERERTTRLVVDTIQKCANGDESAANYLRVILRATRIADDLADRDRETMDTHAETAELLDLLLVQLPVNQFFLAHRDMLLATHLHAINAWAASNAWAGGGPTQETYAHVWRDQVLDVFQIVARLTRAPWEELNLSIRATFAKSEREEDRRDEKVMSLRRGEARDDFDKVVSEVCACRRTTPATVTLPEYQEPRNV